MSIIIYPPVIDWSWMTQRPQHLMKEMSRNGHLVYYCNRTQKSTDIQEIDHNLFLVHNHDQFIKKDLECIRKKWQMPIGLWTSSVFTDTMQYKADWIVYDCVDEILELIPWEQKIVDQANLITCTSERIYKRLSISYPMKKIVVVRNAYDMDMRLHCDSFTLPSEFSSNNIYLGYVGAWAPWVDEVIIKRLASLDKRIIIVVIGAEFKKKFRQNDFSNQICYLGLKNHKCLPSYIQNLSVCLIPFKRNSLTLAVNPVKAYEYLASGLPVVSSNLPECSEMKPHIDIADDHSKFLQLVSQRIKHPGEKQNRIKYALDNTWKKRYTEIVDVFKF